MPHLWWPFPCAFAQSIWSESKCYLDSTLHFSKMGLDMKCPGCGNQENQQPLSPEKDGSIGYRCTPCGRLYAVPCPECHDEQNQREVGYVALRQATAYYCGACRNLYYIDDGDDLSDGET